MRIDYLLVQNFKGFESQEFTFSPQFNLIVGTNGTGKTSALDAIAVAIGSWFLGLRGYDTRHIWPHEVRLAQRTYDEEIRFEKIFPAAVTAAGCVQGNDIFWERSLESLSGRTRYQNASNLKAIAATADRLVREQGDVDLPLISYYGTGRLWQEPRSETMVKSPAKLARRRELSRLSGYRNSVDPRLSTRDLVQWVARQSWIGYQQGKESPVFKAVKKAILNCIEDAENLYFDPKRGEVVVVMREHGAQPFANLSDGQRCMLAMVGDIAQKAATLNPQSGDNVLERTRGVVLIDELDLHLHPRWQRRIVESLRNTFPGLQFICTSHSPFLIQSLRSGEELIMLDGQPTANVANRSIDDIAAEIMGIEQPEVAERYERMKDAAKSYLQLLEEAPAEPGEKLERFKDRLAMAIDLYADNPAYQAYLELKRAEKIGE